MAIADDRGIVKRFLHAWALAISSLLFIAVCVGWVRSYTSPEMIDHWDTSIVARYSDGRDVSLDLVDKLLIYKGTIEYKRLYMYGDCRQYSPAEEEREGPRLLDKPIPVDVEWGHYACKRRLGPPGAIYCPLIYRTGHRPPGKSYRHEKSYYLLCLPIWELAGIFASIPAAALVRRLRRQRVVREGCCLTCGYDLRATPLRCPECGAGRDSTRHAH